MSSRILGYKKDITHNSNWVSHYLIREGFHLDYSMKSLDEVERLFKEHSYIILDDTSHNYLFALACYVGDVLVKNYEGKWLDDEHYILIKNQKVYPYDVINELLNNGKSYLDEVRNL